MASQMTDLLGSLLQTGLKGSTSDRIEHSVGERGIGGEGGLLEQVFGRDAVNQVSKARKSTSGSRTPANPFESLGKMASAVLTEAGQNKSLVAGGLGALVGSILSGGSHSVKGAVGGGALALLGSLALQAFQNAGVKKADDMMIDPSTKLTAGLRDPENDQEERQVQSIAELTLRAMINAAKVDGQIDERELERIVGKVKEHGVTGQERDFLARELRKPLDTEAIVRDVPNQQVAAQVYVASLLAIDLDTNLERDYMRDLAARLNLDDNVVRHLGQVVGVTV